MTVNLFYITNKENKDSQTELISLSYNYEDKFHTHDVLMPLITLLRITF